MRAAFRWCARKSSSQAADDHAVENIRHPEEGGHENGERQPIKFCCHGGVPFLRMPKSDLLVGKCQRVAFSRLGRELSIFLERSASRELASGRPEATAATIGC